MYNGRSHQKWVITEVTPPDVFGSGSRPHPGKAGLQATAYAVETLADDSGSYSRLILGSGCRSLTCRIQQRKQHPMRCIPLRNGSPCGTGDSCDARCGFAPPGTNAGTKARIRYLFSSDCPPCRRVVRGNACGGNTAAHTAPLPAAVLRQCLTGTFLHRQRFSDVPCFCAPCRFPCFP